MELLFERRLSNSTIAFNKISFKSTENIQPNEGTCGVVGYHVRLTRERSPVRARAVAFFIIKASSLTPYNNFKA
jgi:hypothetical protein